MVIIAKMNVLSVGIEQADQCLVGFPIRLVKLNRASEAVRSFKTEHVDSVITHWHLSDMPNGKFLRKLKAAMPEMPTIAIIEADNPQQEIEARSLGVAAVICEDACSEHFQAVVAQVLGVSGRRAIEKVYAAKEI